MYTNTISVVSGIPVSVTIAIKGTGVMFMGLRIIDSNQNTVCERNPGYHTPQGFSICQFCPGCGGVITTKMTYKLKSKIVDSSNNSLGYNGIIMGFTFNGKII